MKKRIALLSASALLLFSIESGAASTPPKSFKGETPAKKSGPIATPVTVTPIASENPILKQFTGNFDITSNYVFRGISASNNLPAVQGGFTYTFATTGIYLNAWGSSVYQVRNSDRAGTIELDTIAGIADKVGNFDYDVSIDRYNYPKADGLNYNEYIANVKYYFVTGQLGYSNNVFDSAKNGTYYNIGIHYDIPPQYLFHFNNVTLKGGIGHYSLPRSAGFYSYNDYHIQLSKTFNKYLIAIQWTTTNGRYRSPPLDDSHLVGVFVVNF